MASIFPQCDSRLLDAIKSASGAIIVAHKNPDGDASRGVYMMNTDDDDDEV